MPTYEIFRMCRKYLRPVTYQLRNRRLGDDGQLPTGWHLLTYWHFTAGRFNCRTKCRVAMSQQNAERRANVYPRSALNRSGIAFAFPRAWEIQRWII